MSLWPAWVKGFTRRLRLPIHRCRLPPLDAPLCTTGPSWALSSSEDLMRVRWLEESDCDCRFYEGLRLCINRFSIVVATIKYNKKWKNNNARKKWAARRRVCLLCKTADWRGYEDSLRNWQYICCCDKARSYCIFICFFHIIPALMPMLSILEGYKISWKAALNCERNCWNYRYIALFHFAFLNTLFIVTVAHFDA